MRILLVEDDSRVASFIRRGLREEQYTVDVAKDCEQGLFLAQTNDYDLIILDQLLPKRPGLEVLRTLRAEHVSTPDFFLFDQAQRLVYRGQFDDSRPGNEKPVTGDDLRAAIDDVLTGQPVPSTQKPSFGCGIIWKPNNKPAYL